MGFSKAGAWTLAVILVLTATGAIAILPANLPSHCSVDKDCLIDVAGSECADGTQSFFQLTLRPQAKHLMFYISGGGACWDQKTCDGGYAKSLTRREGYLNWKDGKGIFDASAEKNPFAKDYHIVTIPYCTGDVHVGDRIADYGSAAKPWLIRHHGYQNVLKTIDAVKQFMPVPEKVVLFGCSAGGIGAYYHLRNLVSAYPSSKKYVISDAGTPFKTPYVYPSKIARIIKNWGAAATLPDSQITDFAGVVAYNSKHYPDIHFGFISGYRDMVMSFFSLAVGSPSPMTAVKDIIIDVADRDLGRDAEFQKVFYTESSRHCHSGEPLDTMVSLDHDLGAWLSSMVGDNYGVWTNSRPDLLRAVAAAGDVKSEPLPTTIEELKKRIDF